jgi:iron transport multicopper oxidase
MRRVAVFSTLLAAGVAKTVNYDWSISWTTAAPDGFSRPVIGVNGKWPPPVMECDVGDDVVLKLTNNLGNETTSIHLHGEFAAGKPQMDGVSGVAQCPIPPGSTFTQRFTANPSGTHWYHSHNKGQYPDGLRGPLIIHDPSWENSLGVEKQYTLTVSDWCRYSRLDCKSLFSCAQITSRRHIWFIKCFRLDSCLRLPRA